MGFGFNLMQYQRRENQKMEVVSGGGKKGIKTIMRDGSLQIKEILHQRKNKGILVQQLAEILTLFKNGWRALN